MKINKVIKILILSDVALVTGFGFIAPITAIFITQKITFGNMGEAAKVAGFAMAIYWGIKSILQIPLANYLDKNHGEKDDLYFIVVGNILAAFSVFGYIFSSEPWHIYLLNTVYSLGMAMNIPGWSAIFTRHIDRGREASESAARSTAIGIGAGISGALGGVVADIWGFNILFVWAGIFALISGLLPILIYDELIPKTKNHHIPKAKGAPEPYLPKP